MIVLSDVDGVLVDFVTGLCLELHARGYTYTPESFRSWDLREALDLPAQRAMVDILSAPGFCQGLSWYEGAREFLSELEREGEVFLLTAPFDSDTWERERKLAVAPFPRGRVLSVPASCKNLVRGDVLIEDHPTTASRWLDSNPNGIALLIDRPWNGTQATEWNCHRRMFRVKSYAEALNTIRECA